MANLQDNLNSESLTKLVCIRAPNADDCLPRQGGSESIRSVCSSETLDRLLDQKELKINFKVPKNIGVDFVSGRSTEMSMTNQQLLVRNYWTWCGNQSSLDPKSLASIST